MSGLMGNEVVTDRFHFAGNLSLAAEAGTSGLPWRTAGTTATAVVNNGALELALTSGASAQNRIVHFDDELPYDIDNLIAVDILAAITVTAGDDLPDIAFGMASTGKGETTFAGLEDAALFRMMANSQKIQCVTEEGGTTTTEVGSQVVGDGKFYHYRIDYSNFSKGVAEVGVKPKAGKGAVAFLSGDPASGGASRQTVNKLFDLSGYSGSLQPVFWIAKASSAEVATLKIREIQIHHKLPK